MSSSDGGGYSLWTVVKAVLITVGLIYLMSIVTWFAQWATVLVAIGGVGYLTYRVARALPKADEKPRPKLLATESTFEEKMRQLEHDERVLDRKIGL